MIILLLIFTFVSIAKVLNEPLVYLSRTVAKSFASFSGCFNNSSLKSISVGGTPW